MYVYAGRTKTTWRHPQMIVLLKEKIPKPVTLERAECYGAKIRFGTCLDSCPNTIKTDFENLDFSRPIQVTFGRYQYIVASGIFGNISFIVWRATSFLLVRFWQFWHRWKEEVCTVIFNVITSKSVHGARRYRRSNICMLRFFRRLLKNPTVIDYNGIIK